MSSLHSEIEFLALAIKSYAKADVKFFCPCPTLFDFSNFSKIFCLQLSVDTIFLMQLAQVLFKPEYFANFQNFQVFLKYLQEK